MIPELHVHLLSGSMRSTLCVQFTQMSVCQETRLGGRSHAYCALAACRASVTPAPGLCCRKSLARRKNTQRGNTKSLARRKNTHSGKLPATMQTRNPTPASGSRLGHLNPSRCCFEPADNSLLVSPPALPAVGLLFFF